MLYIWRYRGSYLGN